MVTIDLSESQSANLLALLEIYNDCDHSAEIDELISIVSKSINSDEYDHAPIPYEQFLVGVDLHICSLKDAISVLDEKNGHDDTGVLNLYVSPKGAGHAKSVLIAAMSVPTDNCYHTLGHLLRWINIVVHPEFGIDEWCLQYGDNAVGSKGA